MKKLIILFLAITILFTSCSNVSKSEEDKIPDNKIFVGVWFTYKEIKSLCDNSKNTEELIENINNILISLKEYKVNNIFLHVRAFDDCFYNSSIFNVSDYCKGEQGKLKFDILKYFIEIAEKQEIAVHAWLNPYRIRNDNDTDKIFSDSFADKILKENSDDERIIITDNSIYYNPAYSEVQSYILNGIREIIENYNVSGIHIDDYFYPTSNENIDKNIYNDYLKNGGELNLADFRRNAVNSLVSSIYSLVKSYNYNILFSISPSADIDKNYNSYYADVKLWSQKSGYADMLIPQIYYGFNHSTMPFDTLLNDWMSLQDYDTKIVIGLAVYKAGSEDIYAKEGSDEWLKNNNIIGEQIYSSNNADAFGWSYFSASYLYKSMNTAVENEKSNIIAYTDSIWKDYIT